MQTTYMLGCLLFRKSTRNTSRSELGSTVMPVTRHAIALMNLKLSCHTYRHELFYQLRSTLKKINNCSAVYEMK